MLYQLESCVLELIKPVICITFIPVTLCSAPHSRHGCRGRFPSESAFAPYVGFGVLMTSNLGTNVILMRYVAAISNGDGDPNLPSGDGNYRCGGE